MRKVRFLVIASLLMLGISVCILAQDQQPGKQEAKHELSQEELVASVPALRDLHEVVYPLWHKAYAEKDYALIKELLPRADTLTAKLDAAQLPGILRDKQAAWDKAKDDLKNALAKLHEAANADDSAAMLSQLEAFHSGYEKLVRTIRPMVKELEAYHQELYKLYHYYAPEYDLENIRSTVEAMKEKILPLKAAELPKRLADRKSEFDEAVKKLEEATQKLAETVKKGKKEKVLEAVEKVHTAYQKAEHIFD